MILIDLIDKGHICAMRENEGKFFFGCSEDVMDRVIGSVKNLNIPHLPFLATSAPGSKRKFVGANVMQQEPVDVATSRPVVVVTFKTSRPFSKVTTVVRVDGPI